MDFAETFFGVMGEARRPTLELVSRLDMAAIARPWLVMLYQVIQATSPVLRHAIDRTVEKDGPLARFYRQKLSEEMGHDALLLSDIEAAGIKDAQSHPANPFVAEMVGRQYYLIDFVHPAIYLGYIGLLEGFPATLEQLGELERLSALPSAALRCARLHAHADVKHREELSRMLDEAPARHRPGILANGIRCAQLHRLALEILSPTETQWTP